MRIAALDLGSNSFHLVVVEAHPDGTFDTLVREKEMLRLGDVVAREGRITAEAADRATASVRRLCALASAADAAEVVACATSAIREADNGAEIVDRLEAETGISIRTISGREEARLVFTAVRASVLLDKGPALCLDLGGGSLELGVGDAAGLLWSSSLKLGVARLTADLVRDDPPSGSDLRRVRKRVRAALEPVAAELSDIGPRMLVGTSGTLCALARMAAANRDGSLPSAVNQLRVRRKDLQVVHRELVAMSAAARARIPGVDGRRADLLPAGSVVALVAMEVFGLDELTVSSWALREGMVLDAIGHHDPLDWEGDPRALRRSSVLALCRRCNWHQGHGRHVARLATELFDQTLSLHKLHPCDRELLEFAAWMHDIGEHVSVDSHDHHGAYLVQHGRLRGFDPQEVAIMASLVRFHRRGVPKPSFVPFAAMDAATQRRVTMLTALLRLADGLDRSKNCVVENVDVQVDGGRLRLHVHAAGDVELELWGLRRKRDLFERAFGLELVPRGCVGVLTRA